MAFIKHLLEHVQKHATEIAGSVTGAGSGIWGMNKGFIIVADDIHAIILAIFTGAAGGLGALVIKAIWNKIFKPKQKQQ